LDFNEIKLFETGHLAKPTVIDRVEAVRNHLRGQWNGKGNDWNVETRPHYTNYFKGIHSFKPYKQQLVTSIGQKNYLLL
jgi:hypothetical protein